MVCDVINMADKDGWTITHLAATRESKVSLTRRQDWAQMWLKNMGEWC